MDRLDAMNLFVRVAELGSFSAVAKQLGVARSVVTRQIAALEAHLGVKLMARSTRRLTLTSGGTAYLEKCRVILNLVEAAETGVAEERLTPRGNIRISLPLSYGLKRLAPILLDFSQRYPAAGIRRRGAQNRLKSHAGRRRAGLSGPSRSTGKTGRIGKPYLSRLHQCRQRPGLAIHG